MTHRFAVSSLLLLLILPGGGCIYDFNNPFALPDAGSSFDSAPPADGGSLDSGWPADGGPTADHETAGDAAAGPALEIAQCSVLNSCDLSFGQVQVTTAKTMNLDITNTGGQMLVMTQADLRAGSDPAFSVVTAFPIQVQPGDSVTVAVRFAPLTAGQAAAILDISTNAANMADGDLQVELTGTGVNQAVPDLTLSQPQCVWGDVVLGSTSPCEVVLGNNGGADLEVTSVGLTPSSPSVFRILSAPTGSFTITPGATATLTIVAEPVAVGSFAGAIEVASNDPDRITTTVPLSCNGVTANDAGVDDVGAADAAAGQDTGETDAGPPVELQVQLTWDTANADLDLHLVYEGPACSSFDCYAGNCLGAGLEWPPAGPEGNPRLDMDDTSGHGPENITLTGLAPGRYRAAAHLNALNGDPTPIQFIIKILQDGDLALETTYTLNSEKQLRYKAEITVGVDGQVTAVSDIDPVTLQLDSCVDPGLDCPTGQYWRDGGCRAWHRETVESTDGAARIAIDDEGQPHIASVEETSLYDHRIWYFNWNGASWEDRDAEGTLTNDGWIYSPSLALDALRLPHIAYTRSDTERPMYAHFDGTEWIVEQIDSVEISRAISLALTGGGLPRAAYYDAEAGDLRYAFDDGAGWSAELISSAGNVGLYASLALDSAGAPHVAHYNETTENLEHCTRPGGVWSCEVVAADGDQGSWCALALDADDHPRIAYLDGTADALKLASHDGAGWSFEVIDQGFSSVVSTALALDSQGDPHVSYRKHDEECYCYATRDGGTWRRSIIEELHLGSYAGSERYTSIAVDAQGRPHVAYSKTRYARFE